MSVKRYKCKCFMSSDGEQVVLASDYDSLLAVLRRCVQEMDDWADYEGWAPSKAKDALSAAREYLEAKP